MYSITDNLDFFIIEIVDKKYQNNFYFIPIQYLIQIGVISTPEIDGKNSILVASYDYNIVRKPSRFNTSGVVGVSKNGKKWDASLEVKGKKMDRKTFNTINEAIIHRKNLEIKYLINYHWSLDFLNKYNFLSSDMNYHIQL
jgi:hypothetical protein